MSPSLIADRRAKSRAARLTEWALANPIIKRGLNADLLKDRSSRLLGAAYRDIDAADPPLEVERHA